MESNAKLKFVRITPRKLGELARVIRGKSINDALNFLQFSPSRRTAGALSQLLKSAVANGTQKQGVDVDKLFVKTLLVGPGPILKRFRPRAKGSAASIHKKTSHVSVVLAERQGE